MTVRSVRGVDYERIAVQTHLIHIKEPLGPVFDEYVKPVLRPADWLAVSLRTGDDSIAIKGGSTGPSPSLNCSPWPSAQGGTTMSLNRIAASKP